MLSDTVIILSIEDWHVLLNFLNTILEDVLKRLWRSCRFQKCIQVVMKAVAVQKLLKSQMPPYVFIPLSFPQTIDCFNLGKTNVIKNLCRLLHPL